LSHLVLAQIPFLKPFKPKDEPFDHFKSSNAKFQFHFGITSETLNLIESSKSNDILFEPSLRKVNYLFNQLSSEKKSSIKLVFDTESLKACAVKLAYLEGDFIVLKRMQKQYQLFLLLLENMRLQYQRLDYSLKHDWKSLFINSRLQHHKIQKDFFKGKPCMIVGAGPSLNLRIEEIKKNKDACFIFATLRAVKKLLENDIQPDCVGVIDPVEFLEMPDQIYLNVPCFFTLNANFLQVQPFFYKVPVAIESDFPFMEIFQKTIQQNKPIEAAHTVSGFLFALAIFFNMSKIILYGVDLCYQGDQKYWSGASEKKEKLILAFDCFNQPVMTKSDFLLSRTWFEWLIKTNRKKTVFNRSIGLKIQGFKNKELIINRRLKKSILIRKKKIDHDWFDRFFNLLPQITIDEKKINELEWILLQSDLQDLGLLNPLNEVFDRFYAVGLVSADQKKSFFKTIIERVQGAIFS
jgi:hypothetical protein